MNNFSNESLKLSPASVFSKHYTQTSTQKMVSLHVFGRNIGWRDTRLKRKNVCRSSAVRGMADSGRLPLGRRLAYLTASIKKHPRPTQNTNSRLFI